MQFVNGGQSSSVEIHSCFLHVSRHGIYSVPLGSDSAQFHHYKPVELCKNCMCICLQPQGGSKAPSVAETAFVIFQQMTYFLSKSKPAYPSAFSVPGGSYTSKPS